MVWLIQAPGPVGGQARTGVPPLHQFIRVIEAIFNDLDSYSWINNSGFLSVADIMGIAREVW